MHPYVASIIKWLPRVLGTLFSVFIGMFALDAFFSGYSFWTAIGAFFIHLLPALTILGFTAVGWHKPGYGALLWAVSAAGFLVFYDNPWQVDVFLSGPQFLVAGLFGLDGLIIRSTKTRIQENEKMKERENIRAK